MNGLSSAFREVVVAHWFPPYCSTGPLCHRRRPLLYALKRRLGVSWRAMFRAGPLPTARRTSDRAPALGSCWWWLCTSPTERGSLTRHVTVAPASWSQLDTLAWQLQSVTQNMAQLTSAVLSVAQSYPLGRFSLREPSCIHSVTQQALEKFSSSVITWHSRCSVLGSSASFPVR